MIRLLLVSALLVGLGYAQEAPRTAEDYVQEGNTVLERNDCQFAQYSFQKALDLEPNNVAASLGMGRALICQRGYDAAIEILSAVTQADSSNVDAYIYLAQAYESQYSSDPSRYPSGLNNALAAIETAEGLNSEDAELLNVKGVVLYRLGDMENARSALERAVTLAGDLPTQDQAQIHVNLGKTYLNLELREEALQAFKRAVALNPASASAHNSVGATYFSLGQCDEAIYELSQAVNLNPGSVEAKFNLGRAYFDCDEVNASVPVLEQAIDIPGSLNLPELYTYMSRAYVALGRFDEAVRRAQQGALLPPSSAEALYYLGEAYAARGNAGDAEDAKKAYESALEIDPAFQPAQDAINRLGQ